ncbi:ATP phosphoribosyltransferase regulatory subunit [Candidatus Margulisiibacteriota bacterium]
MKTQTPQGVRDLLPADVAKRNEVVDKINAVFEKYSYQRIVTPVLELYETLEKGLTPDMKKNSVKFIDRGGQLMVLRPDMTTPIARVVASRMKDAPGPIRLCYVENVFRSNKPGEGRDNEFCQIGIELIGLSGQEADDEVIKIARESLETIGLKNIEIDTGDLNRFKDFPDDKKEALVNGDYVSYGSLPDRDNLVVRDFNYYTGMIFECYVPEVGSLLGNGGRYDNLTGKFGVERPAVGFAFKLNQLMLALEAQRSL